MTDRIPSQLQQQIHSSFAFSPAFVPNTNKPICLAEALQNIVPASHLAAEVEQGNHEYKFKLSNMTEAQVNHRITQLQWRLNEGGGSEAVYHIGVEDNGYPLGLNMSEMQESLYTLQYMAEQADCEMQVKQLYTGEQGITAEVLMKKKESILLTLSASQLTVCVAGDVDAGKSTLIGVLCSNKLDNGRGLSRTRVLTHNHEVLTGRTSSISHNLIHFNKHGDILNMDNAFLPGNNQRVRATSDLTVLQEETQRVVNLLDVAGDAKYLKTTLHGLIGQRPDCIVACVSAKHGLTRILIEHLSLAVYFKLPLILLLTKIDLVISEYFSAKNKPILSKKEWLTLPLAERIERTPALKSVVDQLKEQLSFSEDYSFVLIANQTDLINYLNNYNNNTINTNNTNKNNVKIVPLLCVSCVTGEGVSLLRSLLFQLPLSQQRHTKKQLTLQLPLCEQPFHINGNINDNMNDKNSTSNEKETIVYSEDTEKRFNYIRIVDFFTVSESTSETTENYTFHDHELKPPEGEKEGVEDTEDDGLDWGDEGTETVVIDMDTINNNTNDNNINNDNNNTNNIVFDASRYGTDEGEWDKTLRKKQQKPSLGLSNMKHSSYANFLQTEKGRLHILQQSPNLSTIINNSSNMNNITNNNDNIEDIIGTIDNNKVVFEVEPPTHQSTSSTIINETLFARNKHLLEYDRFVFEMSHFITDSDSYSFPNKGVTAANSTANTPNVPYQSKLQSKFRKIVVGKIQQGRLSVRDCFQFGPSPSGRFGFVRVISVRLNNIPVQYARAGQTATFQIAKLSDDEFLKLKNNNNVQDNSNNNDTINLNNNNNNLLEENNDKAVTCDMSFSSNKRRTEAGGLVLLPLFCRPMCIWEFSAEISLFTQSIQEVGVKKRLLKLGHEVVVHIGAVRQTVKVIRINKTPAVPSTREVEVVKRTKSETNEELKAFQLYNDNTNSKNENVHVHGEMLSLQLWRESSSASDIDNYNHNNSNNNNTINNMNNNTINNISTNNNRKAVYVVSECVNTPRRILPSLLSPLNINNVLSVADTKVFDVKNNKNSNNDDNNNDDNNNDDNVSELYEGEKGVVSFRFVYMPEFVSVGEAIVLREKRILALGVIVNSSSHLTADSYNYN